MMTLNEIATATLDQLTDELGAAGWDSCQDNIEDAREAVARLLLETHGGEIDDHNTDEAAECEWECGVEGRWWKLEAGQRNYSASSAIRWTWSEEAGVDDIEIVERSGSVPLGKWLEDIATTVGSSSGNVR